VLTLLATSELVPSRTQKGEYPERHFDRGPWEWMNIKSGGHGTVQRRPLDFLGINTYRRPAVVSLRHGGPTVYGSTNSTAHEGFVPSPIFGWESWWPDSFHDSPRAPQQKKNEYNKIPIEITEKVAVRDAPTNNGRRSRLSARHLNSCAAIWRRARPPHQISTSAKPCRA